MDSPNKPEGKLTAFVAGVTTTTGGLTGAEIAAAYKAALSDFVSRKTTRGAIAEVSKLLSGALAARRQELGEQLGSSSHGISNLY